MPVISVLLPVYNGAEFIADAIDSVLSQSLEDFELIIRDNCSSDETRKIIRRYKDRRLFFVESKTNVGQFGNFNACFDLSVGKLIHLFCHDDIMHRDCLVTQLALLLKYENAGMVYCGFRNIDKGGRIFSDSSEDKTPEYIDRDLYLRISARYGSLPAAISTVMIRREVLETVGTFDSSMQAAGDLELWNRIADRYPIIHNRNMAVNIRSHANQCTNSSMTGLWYMKEEIQMAAWYRQRLSAVDWACVKDIRTRTRAVTYFGWIRRQIVHGHIGRAFNALIAISAEYSLFRVFCLYCISLGRRFGQFITRIF